MKGFDLFPKLQTDLQHNFRKTTSGGLLFVLTIVMMVVLILHEFFRCLVSNQFQTSSYVESSNFDQRVRVNLNISLSQIPCHALSLELQDVTGAHLEDVQHTLHKFSLFANGSYINNAKVEQIKTIERSISYPSNPIMKVYKRWKNRKQIDDCYGAQLYEGQKCTTCQDVMLAFAARDWPQPPKESIAQCMPDKKATVPRFDFENEFNQALADHQDEILADISKELLEVEEKEKRIKQLQEQQDQMKEKDEAALKDVLSLNQKKHFAKTLQELSEIGQNPMQWSEERLQEEKLNKVGSLINMLNISLDDYTAKLQSQIKFEDREIVLAERKLSNSTSNLTTLTRAKCDREAKVQISVVNDLAHINETLEIILKQGECSVNLDYAATEINDDHILIETRLGQQTIMWEISKSGSVQSVLSNLIFNITEVFYEGEYRSSHFRPSIDIANRAFRISVYVPLKSFNLNTRRILYQEDFTVRTASDKELDLSDAYDIQEHYGEGCQLFGHLFIKKVPGSMHIGFHGRGEAARLLSNEFSVTHIVHLLEFTDEREELTLGRIIASSNPLDGRTSNNPVDTDSNYYLKIVSSVYQSFWGNIQRLYTFTAHEKTTDAREKLPAIIFRYEFDAVTVKYAPQQGSLFQLIVQLFAIVGGVFAVSNMFAKILELCGL